MTQKEFDKITQNSQPHKVYKTDWNSYYTLKFADTFLPKATGYVANALTVFDGAELFKGAQKAEIKELSLTDDEKLINIISYTYPKGALAEERKERVQVAEHEICTFIEINRKNEIDVHFKFGNKFKIFLEEYFSDIGQYISISRLEKKIYKTDIQTFKKKINNKLRHSEMMQYILDTLNIDSVLARDPRKGFVEEVQWYDNNGLINMGVNVSDVVYGETVKLVIKGKRLKDRHPVTVSIGVKIPGHSGIQYFNNLKFDLIPNAETVETPPFKLQYDWYDETKEEYDDSNHITKIDINDLPVISAKIKIKNKEFLLKDDEKLIPDSYRRNYEELIGLYEVGTTSGDKNKIDNYENYFILLYDNHIEDIVNDFTDFIYNTDNLTAGDIETKVETGAKQLWNLAVEQVQNGILDDRPLYWARNKMQVILKRNPVFKDQIDFGKSIVNAGSDLEKVIILFEELSRNYTEIDFSDARPDPDEVADAEDELKDAEDKLKEAQKLPEKTDDEKRIKRDAVNDAQDEINDANDNLDEAKKVYKLLITGYDPFFLDPTKNNNPLQSNPSGVGALDLHGKTINKYYIQTLMCPVRYADFDNFKDGKGIIETFIEPFISEVDIIITMSQGSPFRFDVDRFPCKKRHGQKDNMFRGDLRPEYNDTNFNQLSSGEEFYQTTLPYDKMVPTANNPTDTFWVYLNQTFWSLSKNYTDKTVEGTELIENKTPPVITGLSELQGYTSERGSGGHYLSNEIYYRVAKLREEIPDNNGDVGVLPTGHLHVPLIQESIPDFYPRGNVSTKDMNPKISELIDKIKEIIEKL